MERLQIDVVKQNFGDCLMLVSNAKHRIIIQERGADRAALVPLEDLALLESLDGDKDVPVERVSVEDVKRHLAADLAQVAERAERIILKEGDSEVAALVPERDLAVLENLDTRLDIEAAKRLLEKKIEGED